MKYQIVDNHLIIYDDAGRPIENATELGDECKHCSCVGKCEYLKLYKTPTRIQCNFLRCIYPELE